MLRSLVLATFSLLLMACGAGGAVTPAKAPEPSPDQGPPGLTPPEAKLKPSGLGELPPGVPAPPAECAEKYPNEPPPRCAPGDVKELLASALTPPPESSDVVLRCLEASPELPPGFVRALRADRAPRASSRTRWWRSASVRGSTAACAMLPCPARPSTRPTS